MFEFLFKYPAAAFAKGELVLLGRWPLWLLAAGVLLAAGALAWQIRRRPATRAGAALAGLRPAAVWLLQTCLVALVLLLVWHPALSIATLKPEQNIVAVLIDDSRSMALSEEGGTRLEQAKRTLASGLLADLGRRFQVRLYRFGTSPARIEKLEQATAGAGASHIGESLKEIAAEATSLPIGAVVLLSDGADTRGGIDLETIGAIRRHRIPVHTIGFGREKFARDIELAGVETPARALPDSRLAAQVRIRQQGYARAKARLAVRESGKLVASREVVLANGEQTEAVMFQAGPAGARNLEFTIEPLAGEENLRNNAVAQLVNVEALKPRVLYLEGEPRWEFKFIRRAIEEDTGLQLVSMLRTTENKVYRQGIGDPKELEQGFPARAEELFGFQGLIIGSVESGYFTPAQQELIREFADRRGGGVLFLGGRAALAEGGYARAPFAELLPVTLPERKGTFLREETGVALAVAGRDHVVCRLEERPEKNDERWRKLPPLADHQQAGEPKPGALVLAEMKTPGGRALPLLVTQNYGHGRTAVFATGGSWRWQMLQELSDQSHELFWRQMLRWLVTGAPGTVAASTPRPVVSDESRVPLRVAVRDKAFRPVADARVQARMMGPEGAAETIELEPRAQEPGVYETQWTAEKAGSYVAEIEARRGEEQLGRDVLMVRREDGVAENFRTGQNRELLERLSAQTGGRYYRPAEAARLAKEISYSEAGITVRELRDLWDMPFVFLLALALRSTEWLLRRKWGVV
ncbi:MAG: glutamine amidotransferase [Acidobacteriota bacterium]